MLLPNKVTSLQESILLPTILVIRKLQKQDMSVHSLYLECQSEIIDISTFFQILTFLYAIGKIELNSTKRELHYVA